MKDKRRRLRPGMQTVQRGLLVLIWVSIMIAVFHYRENYSVDGILHFTPDNPFLAGLVLLGLFAVKGASVILYSGILYTASGVLLPIPAAILINILGTAIMVSIPYLTGKKMGSSAVDRIRDKYPKVERLHTMRSHGDFQFALIVRLIGIVPADVASMYMGAVRVDYTKYLIGSVLGFLPAVILYPVMGMGIKDTHAPQFWIALGIKLAMMAGTAIASYIIERRKRS